MRYRRFFIGIAFVAACFLASCAPKPPVSPVHEVPDVTAATQPIPSVAPAAAPVFSETGIASWYGREFHGRKTASGELFDMNLLSAAHRTLPLGAMVRVTNLENQKSVLVKINDRGPFVKSRILDLSYGAAKMLDLVGQGAARVHIEAEALPDAPPVYTVHAAVFAEEENAKLLKDRLSRRYEVVMIVPIETNMGTFYRVRVGAYPSEGKAERIAAKLTLEGMEPLVMRKD